MTPKIQKQREVFRVLHQQGCFVIPNPWDAGSAIYLEHLGFQAVATTSAGFAFTRGLPDTVAALSCDTVLDHITQIVRATTLPVNADFQSGYASTADGVAANVGRCIQTGVAGLSIEDATGDPGRPLYDLAESVDRIRAARSAIDACGTGVILTARAECFLVKHPDPLRESIRRLCAYAEAGADVLYAPGLTTQAQITEIVRAVAPKPINVLVSSRIQWSVQDLADLGVRRVSLGSALARAAWGGFIRAVSGIRNAGEFSGLDQLASFSELNHVFQSDGSDR